MVEYETRSAAWLRPGESITTYEAVGSDRGRDARGTRESRYINAYGYSVLSPLDAEGTQHGGGRCYHGRNGHMADGLTGRWKQPCYYLKVYCMVQYAFS